MKINAQNYFYDFQHDIWSKNNLLTGRVGRT